jgi:hypothetical protein
VNTASVQQRNERIDEPAGDGPQLATYDRISGLAIASLLLGLASPVCMTGLMLLVVPLAGAAAAVAALRQIAASDGALAGRRAAIIGLVLSVFCSFAVISHSLVSKHYRTAQAAEFGHQWLVHLVKGDTHLAFRWKNGGIVPTSEEQFGPEGDPYKNFVEMPEVQKLLSFGPNAQVDSGVNVKYEAMWGREWGFRERYIIRPAASGAATSDSTPVPVLLTLRRVPLPGESQPTWFVSRIEFARSLDDSGDD